MADDIVTRLQARCCLLASQSPNDEGVLLAIQAANEIARLRAENEKLRAALKPLADEVEYVPSRMDDDDWYEMDTIKVGHIRIAAAALKETGDE